MSWDVLGFGVVAVDDLIFIDRFPLPGQKEKINKLLRQGGGLAGTALVACARLGVSAAYMGILGYDDLSKFTIEELEKEGVNTSLIKREKGAGPFYSIILVDQISGERIIYFSLKAVKNPSINEIPREHVLSSKVIFLDYTVIDVADEIITLAHSRNIPIVADIELIEDDRIFPLMYSIDHLIINLEMGQSITHQDKPKEIIHYLHKKGTKNCVITDGENGCWYSLGHQEIAYQPAYKVNVVDTTGCGDVFHGAYAAALAMGQDISYAIKLASATAALKATQLGGRKGIPSIEEAERLIRESENEK